MNWLPKRPAVSVLGEQEDVRFAHFARPNDIEFSGERKRVRCKDEVDSSFMT